MACAVAPVSGQWALAAVVGGETRTDVASVLPNSARLLQAIVRGKTLTLRSLRRASGSTRGRIASNTVEARQDRREESVERKRGDGDVGSLTSIELCVGQNAVVDLGSLAAKHGVGHAALAQMGGVRASRPCPIPH